MKVDKNSIIKAVREARERVSNYSPEEKAELLRRARLLIKKGRKK